MSAYKLQYRNERTQYEWRDAPDSPMSAAAADAKVKRYTESNRTSARGNPHAACEYRAVPVAEEEGPCPDNDD